MATVLPTSLPITWNRALAVSWLINWRWFALKYGVTILFVFTIGKLIRYVGAEIPTGIYDLCASFLTVGMFVFLYIVAVSMALNKQYRDFRIVAASDRLPERSYVEPRNDGVLPEEKSEFLWLFVMKVCWAIFWRFILCLVLIAIVVVSLVENLEALIAKIDEFSEIAGTAMRMATCLLALFFSGWIALRKLVRIGALSIVTRTNAPES